MPTTGGASTGGWAAGTGATAAREAGGPSGCVRFCWSITFCSLRSRQSCAGGQGRNIQGWNGPLPAAARRPAAADILSGQGGAPSRPARLGPARRASPIPAFLIPPPVLRGPAPRELGNPSVVSLRPRGLQLEQVNLPHLRRQPVEGLLPSAESR